MPQISSEKGIATQPCPMSAGSHWADKDPPKIRLFKPVYHITMGTMTHPLPRSPICSLSYNLCSTSNLLSSRPHNHGPQLQIPRLRTAPTPRAPPIHRHRSHPPRHSRRTGALRASHGGLPTTTIPHNVRDRGQPQNQEHPEQHHRRRVSPLAAGRSHPGLKDPRRDGGGRSLPPPRNGAGPPQRGVCVLLSLWLQPRGEVG